MLCTHYENLLLHMLVFKNHVLLTFLNNSAYLLFRSHHISYFNSDHSIKLCLLLLGLVIVSLEMD